MTATPSPEFQTYLGNIVKKYQHWSNYGMLMDSDGQVFDVGLMVKICQPKSCKGIQKHEKQENIKPFLEIGSTLTDDCVLLVGKPGSGKSTALRQLLWLEAQAAIRGEKRKIPVLLELRYWDTSVETLIYKFLRKHQQRIDIGKIEDLLLDEELLLLVDGLNELPSDEARDKVARFRHDYPETPMIFTTRDLGVGGNLGIEKQLEIQPLTETQMQEFVRKYLPEQGEQMLQQLGYRLQELGQTPFILKMLCDVFVGEGEIPKSRGELFRLFHSTVNKLKEEKEAVPVAEGLRIWKAELLQHLAFVMMQPENPQADPRDFRLSISRTKAETILEDFLKGRIKYPAQKAKEWLEGLLKHCFVERKASESGQVLIQFHHHFFQEYYAAEYLLQLLPKLSDVKLKRDYLNLRKWTESVALALDLLEDEVSAVRVVGLALDIDLMLGARLAGEVKKKFQEKTVELILRLKVPHRLKIELLGITGSEQARLQLRQECNNALDYGDFDNVHHLAEALSCIGDDEVMFKLWELEKEHDSKMNQYLTADDWHKFYICQDIYSELEKTESSDVAVLKIVKLLNDKQFLNKGSDKYFKSRNYQAKKMLGERAYNQCISLLLKSLNNEDFRVRYYAASALENIGSDAEIRYVTKALEDEKYFVCSNFSEALGKFGTDTVITHLIKKLTEGPKFPSFRVAEILNKFLSDELIDGLIQGLKHKSNVVRSRAVKALGKMNYEKGLKYLLEALNDESSNVRLSAINALVDFGKVNYNSESLIEAIASALKDEDSSVRLSAIKALINFDKIESSSKFLLIEAIASALKDEDSSVRLNTAHALMNFGKINSKMNYGKINYRHNLLIEILTFALNYEDSSVSLSAAYVLGKINQYQLDSLMESSKYSLFDSITDKESLVQSVPPQLENILEDKFLPQMQNLLLVARDEMKDVILEIQGKYKFYNYGIFHSPQVEDDNCNALQTPQITYDMRGAKIANVANIVHGNQETLPLQYNQIKEGD